MKLKGNVKKRLNHLLKESKLDYPNSLQYAFEIHKGKGDDLPDWHDGCFIPIAGWISVISAQNNNDMIDASAEVGRIAALETFRLSKRVYGVDADIYQQIKMMPKPEDVNPIIFEQLPDYCIYVDTPESQLFNGFFAYLDDDAQHNRKELRIFMTGIRSDSDTVNALVGDDRYYSIPIHLDHETISGALASADLFASDNLFSEFTDSPFDDASFRQLAKPFSSLSEHIGEAINALLFVISQNDHNPSELRTISLNRTKKPKGKFKEPDNFTAVNVSIKKSQRTSPASSISNSDALRKSPKAHMRSAHFRGQWFGKARSQYRVIWIAPSSVNFE